LLSANNYSTVQSRSLERPRDGDQKFVVKKVHVQSAQKRAIMEFKGEYSGTHQLMKGRRMHSIRAEVDETRTARPRSCQVVVQPTVFLVSFHIFTFNERFNSFFDESRLD